MTSASWTDAAALDDLNVDDVTGLEVQGFDIAFFRVDGEIWATSNACTHGDGRLCDGFLLGHEIECPLHQGRFDVRNGRALCTPVTEDLRVYPVKIEAGRVWVALD